MRSSLLLLVTVSALTVSSLAVAAVADSHAARGLPCTACHTGEKPALDNVSEQPCLTCHGEKPEGRKISVDGHTLDNVHTGHFDTYECLQCHKGHQASVFACAECHKTTMKVP